MLHKKSFGPKKKNVPLLVNIALGLDITNEELVEQMREMKKLREKKECEHIVCFIAGFDDDNRELYEIPEVRAFCRRLVSIGFISYLDAATSLPGCDDAVKGSYGAFEVWLTSENRMNKKAEFPITILDELKEVLNVANEKTDKLFGG